MIQDVYSYIYINTFAYSHHITIFIFTILLAVNDSSNVGNKI